jgi:hypothetical protein
MGKSTFSMAMFNSYVTNFTRGYLETKKTLCSYVFTVDLPQGTNPMAAICQVPKDKGLTSHSISGPARLNFTFRKSVPWRYGKASLCQ